MKRILSIFLLMICLKLSGQEMKFRGIVYDVGLQFNKDDYSVKNFDEQLVKYDISTIANILRANMIRIEGEDISRLVKAAEIAHNYGLKIFFNPWLMGGNPDEVVKYMSEAAKQAEKLRLKGVDLVFVAGCEFSIFCNGIFEGNTVNQQLNSMMTLVDKTDFQKTKQNFELVSKN